MEQLGFIFDLDGTIVDSTAYYRETWLELIREFGSSDDPELYLRRATRENFRVLLGDDIAETEMEDLAARQARMGKRKMQERGVQAHTGIPELIADLHARGVKLAIATAAERSNAEWTLEQLGIRNFFDSVVVDQDVARGKPAPDIYLEAMRRLNVDTAHCAVMEDSGTGVRAAKAAGLRVIAVVTTHSRRELEEAGADRIVEEPREIDAGQVIRFISSL
ncbi:MAG TPA: HAD family phosphatase [Anaerolineae bacterium]|nr:HAD family phosphatase [Anaerolineae bacterium]